MALEQLPELFTDGRRRKRSPEEVEKEALYKQIGRLKVELAEKTLGVLDQ